MPETKRVNIRDLGAYGNGINDDTSAVFDCLSSIEEHTIVYFPAGTYIIDESSEFECSHVVIEGDGPDATIIQSRNNSIVVLVGSNTVRNLRCVGFSLLTAPAKNEKLVRLNHQLRIKQGDFGGNKSGNSTSRS